MAHSEVVEADTEPGRRPNAPGSRAQPVREGMAKEPDNLVLRMLREIRATPDRHERRFDKIDKRFDRMDKKLDDMSAPLTTALGLALHANVRHESVQKQLDALEQRVQKLEERV
jgi:tetrahydromethanopterin S-methyltransferase subunit G